MKTQLIDLKNEVQKGREGKALSIPFAFTNLKDDLDISQQTYYLVGGRGGTGKTAFADLIFILYPYNWWLANKDKTDIKFRAIYRSMERSQRYKLAKWAAFRLWIKYSIIVDVKELLGRRTSKITDELWDKFVESLDYMNEMLDYVEVIDGSMNPTGIYKHVKEYAETVGTFVETPYITKEGIQRSKKTYKPNDSNLFTIVLIDHAGKSTGEIVNGKYLSQESKELIDRLSHFCGSEFRDNYGFSPVLISQFNRGLEDTTRRVKTEMSPLPSDFKNTGNTYDDADVVLALYNPLKTQDNNNLGYNIPSFVIDGKNRFRSIYLLKNTYGADDLSSGSYFLGENGYMKPLPISTNITSGDMKLIQKQIYK